MESSIPCLCLETTSINQSTKKFINISITQPIDIPIKENKNSIILDQYSLNLNNFNPSKMSPPNFWKFRLESRLKSHYNKSLSLNK